MSSPSRSASTITSILLAGLTLAPASAAEPTSVPGSTSEPDVAAISYPDPVGDPTVGSGPDIVGVTVSRPDASSLRFSVELAADPPLGYDVEAITTDELRIGLATVPDPAFPADYGRVIGVHGANLGEAEAQGAPMYDQARPEGNQIVWDAVDVTVDGHTVAMTIDPVLLGGPDLVAFYVAASSEGSEGTLAYDICPDEEDLPAVYPLGDIDD